VRRALLIAAVLCAFAGLPGVAEAKRSVPQGFFGTTLDGPLNNSAFGLSGETSVMSRSGVESVRFVISWRVAQPFRSFAEVPPAFRARFRDEGGVPTYWKDIDRFVAAAARRGLQAMPATINTPAWARVYPDRRGSPPQTGAFAGFARALARRYGPNGRFWRVNRRLRRVPVRDWQLLNEVNHAYYWDEPGVDPDNIDNTESAAGYVNLLRRARAAIKSVDRRARIIHAGIDSRSWEYVRAVYRAGGRRVFDAYAVHPFTDKPENVLLILRYVRREMNRAGDRRKPIVVSEWSFPSSRGIVFPDNGNLSRTPQGQAREVGRVQRIFARWRKRLRLQSVFHYTWLSNDKDDYRFAHSGLRTTRTGRPTSKPALRAYARTALAYEGCRRKSSRSATRCLRRR
jgi:hypothetical protein